MIDLVNPNERDANAGEYVLGTLGEEDRAAFEAALARDPALQADVYRWQDQLLALSAQAAAAAPRAQLWRRIDVAVTALAAAPPQAAAATRPASAPQRWWQRVAPWQGLSAVALAASVVLATTLVLRGPGSSTPPARYLALLQSPQDKSAGWVVEIDAGRSLHLIPLAGAAPAQPGRAMQFWTKPKDASAPTSLGLVNDGQTVVLPVTRLPAVGEQQLFEITSEPPQGSPTGRPTGPILYVGRTVQL